MSVTREEILAAIEARCRRRDRAKLHEHRGTIDDATDLVFELGLDSMLVIDLVTWLSTRVGYEITADDVDIEDVFSISGLLRLAARYERDPS